MYTNKSVLDDALHSVQRRILQSIAGSVCVIAAAGGLLVVPEILADKSVTAAIAKLAQPAQTLERVLARPSDHGVAAPLAAATPADAFEAQAAGADIEPAEAVVASLPEPFDPGLRVFDPMPEPSITDTVPPPAAAFEPAEAVETVEAAVETIEPVEAAVPMETAQPVPLPQPAERASEPRVVSVPLPRERPRAVPAEPQQVVATPEAPEPQPMVLASLDPQAAVPPAETTKPAPMNVPAGGEAIPTEYYSDPNAVAATAIPVPRPRPADLAQTAAAPRPKTPAEILGLAGSERARAERCLAQAVYFEARSEPVRGQLAVAQVVMNRVFSPYYPNEVCGVVFQNAHRYLSCQFTFACEGKALRITEHAHWRRAQRIARQTLDGQIWRPEVAKATHYHADYVNPYWVSEMRALAKHGRHIFYRPHRWGDGREEPGWVLNHEMPMPRSRPVMVASAPDGATMSLAAASTQEVAAAAAPSAAVQAD